MLRREGFSQSNISSDDEAPLFVLGGFRRLTPFYKPKPRKTYKDTEMENYTTSKRTTSKRSTRYPDPLNKREGPTMFSTNPSDEMYGGTQQDRMLSRSRISTASNRSEMDEIRTFDSAEDRPWIDSVEAIVGRPSLRNPNRRNDDPTQTSDGKDFEDEWWLQEDGTEKFYQPEVTLGGNPEDNPASTNDPTKMSSIKGVPPSPRHSSTSLAALDSTLDSSTMSMGTTSNASSKPFMQKPKALTTPCPLCGSTSGQVTIEQIEAHARGMNMETDPDFRAFRVLRTWIQKANY